MGRPVKNLSGLRFVRLVVLERDCLANNGSGIHAKWICQCDCGNKLSVYGFNLQRGTTKSCGCFQKDGVKSRSTTHGQYGTKTYWCWFGAQKRAWKKQCMPKWANKKTIKLIYNNVPDGYEVDHIIPLKSPVVCGLHVEHNLQYLTPLENARKKNKLLENVT